MMKMSLALFINLGDIPIILKVIINTFSIKMEKYWPIFVVNIKEENAVKSINGLNSYYDVSSFIYLYYIKNILNKIKLDLFLVLN